MAPLEDFEVPLAGGYYLTYGFVCATTRVYLQVLRHGGETCGLSVRSDGGVDLIEMLQYLEKRGFTTNVEELLTIEHNDEKGRFIIDLSEQVIRCSQGHSMKIVTDDHLVPVPLWAAQKLPCIHGTFYIHLESISKWGLVAGGLALDRNHVHFTPFSPDQRRKGDSWIREDSEVLVQVHMEKAFKAGIKFFKSENNALLCHSVPPEFIGDFYWDFADGKEKLLPGRGWQ